MFRAEVTDVNANPEYANQTDIGVLTQKLFYFTVRNDFFFYIFPLAEVAIYVQAHTDNGPIFSPPWSPAHPIIRAEVVEEQDPRNVFLRLEAYDPVRDPVPISHYELVEKTKPIIEATTRSPPDPGTPLESLFDQIRFTNETDLAINATKEMHDPDISTLINLDVRTGELTFKRRVDYEELVNKVSENNFVFEFRIFH